MATSDPLLLLRTSLGAGKPPTLTIATEPSEPGADEPSSFSSATHLYFSYPTPQCIPLATQTRFTTTSDPPEPIDLRSIFFAWTQKDIIVTDYLANTTELNASLREGQKIRNLPFVEKIDLIAWLEGASDISEYIKGDDDIDAVDGAAGIAAGLGVAIEGGTGVGVAQHGAGGRPVKVIDARLQVIYNGERKISDHNMILRGIKPTDFSHVRKHAELFLGRRARPNNSSTSTARPGQKPIPSRPLPMATKPVAMTPASKRSDPIILLSPSASSLLRMSNIKSFLDNGLFVPPDHPTLSSQTTANLLHVTRPLTSLSTRPYRFILVDSPDNFKPDYWSRVVAVFTTGQTWQFRGYKWREPAELFRNVMGVYVGEKGQPVPPEVRGWGSGVRCFNVERWDERLHGQGVDPAVREGRRWRDREVVEEVWRGLENYMRSRGGEWKR